VSRCSLSAVSGEWVLEAEQAAREGGVLGGGVGGLSFMAKGIAGCGGRWPGGTLFHGTWREAMECVREAVTSMHVSSSRRSRGVVVGNASWTGPKLFGLQAVSSKLEHEAEAARGSVLHGDERKGKGVV
jgi:hypothetical protein